MQKLKKFIVAFVILQMTVLIQNTMAADLEYEAVPGEYIVKLKDNVDLNAFIMAGGQNESASIVLKDQNIVKINRPMVEVASVTMEEIKNSPYVEYIEPNYIYRINKQPNDPELSKLWGLINTGDNNPKGGKGIAGVDIDAERAWEIQTGSKDVIVAVIDTGIDPTLSDLSENMWVNEAELNGTPGVDDDGNGFVDDIHGYDFANKSGNLIDDHGHGSHVSGTIGAKGNDGKGIVGVAWNVRLMGLKFLSKSGGGSLEDALKSIDYATKMGAHIMSNSWGGGGFSQALFDSIQRASDAGILFVAAAGNHRANNDERPSYPASYDVPNVISVAAVDNKGQLASFSCYGKTSVDMGAPGVDIMSSTPDGYAVWDGTSMATPHVSGVAALVLSNEPNLSMVDLRERLIKTSRPVSGLRGKVASNGIINAYYALTNEVPEGDPNDPFYWDKQFERIETAHPYDNKADKTWTLSVPGAKQVSVYISKLDTERGYDKLTILNAKGEVVDVLSGTIDEYYSLPSDGDSLTLVFQSDDSVNKFGFIVEGLAYR